MTTPPVPWSLVLALTIPAVPVGQPRPRAVAFGGRARMHELTHVRQADGTRKPHPIAAFKATCRLSVQQVFHDPPLEGPLRVDLTFVFPRPQGLIWKTRPMPRLPHTKKPDRDNVDKAVMDALTGLLWRDDCQVISGTIEKWIAGGDEQPHVRMTVSRWEGA